MTAYFIAGNVHLSFRFKASRCYLGVFIDWDKNGFRATLGILVLSISFQVLPKDEAPCAR